MPNNELIFTKMYEDHFDDLFLYAKAICKSEDLAKDAISEVFTSLWNSGREFSRIKDVKSYLLVSVKNECIKIHYENKGVEPIGADLMKIEKINPEDILLEKELLRVMDQAVQELPDHCQLIFDMARNKLMSHKEIAYELGISPSTVSTQLGRALKAIRLALHNEYGSEMMGAFSKLAMMLSIPVTLWSGDVLNG